MRAALLVATRRLRQHQLRLSSSIRSHGSRATKTRDNRLAIAADKGPYVDAAGKPPAADPTLLGSDPAQFTVMDSKPWPPFHSPNHGGEGQIELYADGHASFVRTPTVGVDHDHIYTVALDNSTYAGISWVSRPGSEAPIRFRLDLTLRARIR
ncbi:MAG: hypothetical protein IH987_19865 [Planctomycetes bacterium]|nr:hypothetical protein [Planctomycetota bacterium]